VTVSDDDLSNLLNEELYARRVKALFLSNAGATIAKIAEECQVSTATVRKDLEIAKRQYLAETPEQRRATQMGVIMDMRKANYPAMMRGDVDAGNLILRGLKQEASLFGLYPKVLEVPGIDTVAAANEAAALIERIAQIDPAGLKEITRGHTDQPPLDVTEVPDPAADAPVRSAVAGSGDGSTGASAEGASADPSDGSAGAAVPDAGQRPGEVDAGTGGEEDSTATPAEPGEASAGDPDDDGWSNIGG
jgi:predicted transcriptional regulator